MRIEAGDRLIQYEEIGLVPHGQKNSQTLFLAAREVANNLFEIQIGPLQQDGINRGQIAVNAPI